MRHSPGPLLCRATAGARVFDLGTALRPGGDQLAVRLVSQRGAAWAGVLLAAVEAAQ